MILTSSTHYQDSGFTLTELMIAAFISISVVAFGGWGVAAIISSSKTNESQNERRGELNRALDFVAAEVRESVNINSDMSSPAPTEFTSALNASSEEVQKDSIQEILRLQVPGLSSSVIYYIASPSASNKTWRGPKIVYRWGPPFDKEGHYDVDTKTKLGSWTHAPLIDALENTDLTETCPKDWKSSPEKDATGFYACIDPSHKIAQLHSIGRVNKVLGVTAPYTATSQAFARTAVLPVLPSIARSGEITLPAAATMKMEILGSAIQCGEDGTPMKTQLVINKVIDGQTMSSTLTVDPNALPPIPSYERQPAGTTFNFSGSIPPESQNINNTCDLEKVVGSVNSLDNSVQVKILQNGGTVPEVKGFAGSASAKDILRSKLDPSGKIKIEANQYIILFELGVKDDISSDAFDLQDLVVLATVNPV
jgi:hypothetical protein